MILRLARANRRRAPWIWTMAFVFAVAPIHSMGFAAPAGAFSAVVIHAHDGGREDHSHHSHDHDQDGTGIQDGLGPQGDGGPVHQGKGNLHVHHDACCPSVLVPDPAVDLPEQRLGKAFDRSLTQSLHGASPDSLLRPPISQLHI